MVYAEDLKSLTRKGLWVRVPLPAQKETSDTERSRAEGAAPPPTHPPKGEKEGKEIFGLRCR